MKFQNLYAAACEYAPIELSYAAIKAGMYDNSGVIIETDRDITKVLFALDLSIAAAEYAVKNGCQAVVTHHPAIFSPIKHLSLSDNKALTLCALNGIGVISMHLNLDIADNGIDHYLAKGLGAKDYKILTYITENNGYGRTFEFEETALNAFKRRIEQVFETDNVFVFGNREKCVKRVACFCGAGVDINELNLSADADVIVSADMKHHIITEALNRGKCVVQMTHYASENYGMKFFANAVGQRLPELQIEYFTSKEY